MDDFERTLGELIGAIKILDERLGYLETVTSQGDSLFIKRVGVSSSYSAGNRDCYIGVTNTLSGVTINLPAAGSNLRGMVIIIKDESGSAAGNPITVSGNGALIDGTPTRSINTNYGMLRLVCSGVAWFII